MEKRMHQLAACLYEAGVRKGDRVGIYLHRSLETAIAIYGILHVGAVYVPIDPKAPIARSQFLISDCNIKVLISHRSQKRNLEKIIADPTELKTIIGLEESWSVDTLSWETVYQGADHFEPPYRVLEKDLAYIMYTSGSTGQPKGIMHTHYSGLSYARLTTELYGVTEQDVVGNHAPIHFDICTFGYFTSPFAGACTVIVTDAATIFPASLGELIEKEKITIWYSVPLALIQMLQNGILDEKKMSALRWMLYGGEEFPIKYLRTLMDRWPHTTFCNVYGPAEVNQCTYYHIPELPTSDDPIPIGQIWGNTDYLIINEEGDRVDDNETGELLIRSATQMKGYWNNSELTEKSLYKEQDASGEEMAFYKTGDLVKEIDGVLLFLGRKDFQVKIRGYRVELGAVENLLLTHQSVKEAAVFPVRISEEKQQIEAAVILNAGSTEKEKDLIDFLKTKLPFYAVPTELKLVDDFPRTSSGKIKRSAIKKLVL